MKVKTVFPKRDLYENDYVAQPRGFVIERKERKGCHL
jgi:hypothetical protein